MAKSTMVSRATKQLGWLILALILSSPVRGGEARRCLQDGKIVITDVSCELLGNAKDLSPPIPKNYIMRGEPEARSYPPSSPVPPVATSAAPLAQTKSSVSMEIGQMVLQLFQTVLLPFMAILALVAWFTQKTKRSLQRKLGNVLIEIVGDHFARQAKVESSSSKPSDLVRARQEPSWDTPPSELPIVRPSEWSLSLIRDLEWKRFEDVCQQYYELKGIRSETTPLGPDGGIDIRLYQDDSEKPTAIVQCKSWNVRYVGVSLIRELLGVMTHEKIAKAFFMTTSSFSEDAKSFASANRITLVDGPLFLMMIQRLPASERDKLLAFATEGDYQTPTCPSCGVKMVTRSGSPGRSDFWGCPRYPTCRQVLWKRRE